MPWLKSFFEIYKEGENSHEILSALSLSSLQYTKCKCFKFNVYWKFFFTLESVNGSLLHPHLPSTDTFDSPDSEMSMGKKKRVNETRRGRDLSWVNKMQASLWWEFGVDSHFSAWLVLLLWNCKRRQSWLKDSDQLFVEHTLWKLLQIKPGFGANTCHSTSALRLRLTVRGAYSVFHLLEDRVWFDFLSVLPGADGNLASQLCRQS